MISTVLNEFLKRSVARGSNEADESESDDGSESQEERKGKGKGKGKAKPSPNLGARALPLPKVRKSILLAQFKASMLVVY